MKMSAELYSILHDGFVNVINSRGSNAATIVNVYKGGDLSFERMMWDLYRVVSFDLQYDDSHPAYHPGTKVVYYPETKTYSEPQKREPRIRLNDYNPKFAQLINGLNDEHIFSGLKKIAKELGLTY